MPKKTPASSLGRIIAIVRALWHFYWYVVVQGALWLDGKLKDRKRKKKARKKKEDSESKRPK